MNRFAGGIYVVLLALSLFSNKYVLTELGFQFPMVFQGWQMLVGFVVLRALSILPSPKNPSLSVVAIDRSAFVSLLPGFMLFTVSIIAGSKALAHLPALVVVVGSNLLPAAVHLVDNRKGASLLQTASAVLVIASACVVIVASEEDHTANASHIASLMDSPKFWLVVHAFSGLAMTLHGRIADARYGAVDRLFYAYVFSLVVLAPASLYLEEAFEALHFRHRKQVGFIVGSLFSAVVGVAVNLYAVRLKEDEHFGRLHHLGLVTAALLSAPIFSTVLPWWGWLAAGLNLVALPFVPTHLLKDDNQLNNSTTTSQQPPTTLNV